MLLVSFLLTNMGKCRLSHLWLVSHSPRAVLAWDRVSSSGVPLTTVSSGHLLFSAGQWLRCQAVTLSYFCSSIQPRETLKPDFLSKCISPWEGFCLSNFALYTTSAMKTSSEESDIWSNIYQTLRYTILMLWKVHLWRNKHITYRFQMWNTQTRTLISKVFHVVSDEVAIRSSRAIKRDFRAKLDKWLRDQEHKQCSLSFQLQRMMREETGRSSR